MSKIELYDPIRCEKRLVDFKPEGYDEFVDGGKLTRDIWATFQYPPEDSLGDDLVRLAVEQDCVYYDLLSHHHQNIADKWMIYYQKVDNDLDCVSYRVGGNKAKAQRLLQDLTTSATTGRRLRINWIHDDLMPGFLAIKSKLDIGIHINKILAHDSVEQYEKMVKYLPGVYQQDDVERWKQSLQANVLLMRCENLAKHLKIMLCQACPIQGVCRHSIDQYKKRVGTGNEDVDYRLIDYSFDLMQRFINDAEIWRDYEPGCGLFDVRYLNTPDIARVYLSDNRIALEDMPNRTLESLMWLSDEMDLSKRLCFYQITVKTIKKLIDSIGARNLLLIDSGHEATYNIASVANYQFKSLYELLGTPKPQNLMICGHRYYREYMDWVESQKS